MDWNNLLSFVAGGLIAIIPVIIANRFQSKERDKDRLEQRREAKTQLALELTRADVKAVEDTISAALNSINTFRFLKSQQFVGLLSEEQLKVEIQSMFKKDNNEFFKSVVADTTVGVLAYTFGKEFALEYQKFDKLHSSYIGFVLKLSSLQQAVEQENDNSPELINSAARLHTMLREKLISLRE